MDQVGKVALVQVECLPVGVQQRHLPLPRYFRQGRPVRGERRRVHAFVQVGRHRHVHQDDRHAVGRRPVEQLVQVLQMAAQPVVLQEVETRPDLSVALEAVQPGLLQLCPGRKPRDIAQVAADLQVAACLCHGLRKGVGPEPGRLVRGPQADGVAVVEQLPQAVGALLDEMPDHPSRRVRPHAQPFDHVGDVHERSGALRLEAAIVEVAGRDAVDEQARRCRQTVFDGVPHFRRGGPGQTEVERLFELRAVPHEAAQDGGVNPFRNRRAADDDEIARLPQTSFQAAAVVVRIVGVPQGAVPVDQDIEGDETDQEIKGDAASGEPAEPGRGLVKLVPERPEVGARRGPGRVGGAHRQFGSHPGALRGEVHRGENVPSFPAGAQSACLSPARQALAGTG